MSVKNIKGGSEDSEEDLEEDYKAIKDQFDEWFKLRDLNKFKRKCENFLNETIPLIRTSRENNIPIPQSLTNLKVIAYNCIQPESTLNILKAFAQNSETLRTIIKHEGYDKTDELLLGYKKELDGYKKSFKE